jgi:flavin reductase (DIM6/NTAB) family NADH-FMN oxidoreductase RutF
VQHLVEVSAVTRASGLVRGDLPGPSFVISTAKRSGGGAGALADTVCSIQSLPCSIVNSVSHMSS